MDINTYLDRIGYAGPLRPDRETLGALMAAQVRAAAFENLNQQMGLPVSMELDRIYRKIVQQGRGGWCFELNTLFRWALQTVGFEVSVLAGYVRSDKPTPDQSPDHMLLRVDCDGPLLVDVGFGGAMCRPLPLVAGVVSQPPYRLTLSEEADGFFRYTESFGDSEASYWFNLEPVDRQVFEPANNNLQSDPTSPFRRTLTAQRRYPERHIVLRGLVKRTIDDAACREETLQSKDALVECLRQDFDLEVPEVAACWPAVQRRHEELFGIDDGGN